MGRHGIPAASSLVNTIGTPGMECTVTEHPRGRFPLGEITVQGKPLAADKVYTVMRIGAEIVMEDDSFWGCPQSTVFK